MEFLLFESTETHYSNTYSQINLVYLNNISHIFPFYSGSTISFNVVNRPSKFSETDFDGEWNK